MIEGRAIAPRGVLARGFLVKFSVIRALINRELIAKYGRDNLGFLWTIVEPMLLCMGVLMMWSFIKPPYEHGVPLGALVFTAYMPLTLWRHMVTSCIMLHRRYHPLLYHPRITGMDILIARMVSEFIGTSAASVILFLVLLAIGQVEPIEHLAPVIGGWFLLGWFGFSAGMIVAALTDLYESADKFIQPIMYVTLPISGAFVMIAWLPSTARDLLWYFPLPHAWELIRSGFFGDRVETFGSAIYLAIWSALLSGVGFHLIERVTKKGNFV